MIDPISQVIAGCCGMIIAIILYETIIVAPIRKDVKHFERQLQHERAKEPQSLVFRI